MSGGRGPGGAPVAVPAAYRGGSGGFGGRRGAPGLRGRPCPPGAAEAPSGAARAGSGVANGLKLREQAPASSRPGRVWRGRAGARGEAPHRPGEALGQCRRSGGVTHSLSPQKREKGEKTHPPTHPRTVTGCGRGTPRGEGTVRGERPAAAEPRVRSGATGRERARGSAPR